MALILKSFSMVLLAQMIGCSSGQEQSKYKEHGKVPTSLDFGITSLPPHFFMKANKIRGSDVLIVELLAKTMDFKINAVKTVAGGPNALVQLVKINCCFCDTRKI